MCKVYLDRASGIQSACTVLTWPDVAKGSIPGFIICVSKGMGNMVKVRMPQCLLVISTQQQYV